MTVPDWVGTYFGPPWPSGICDEGRQVETPWGRPCALCEEAIIEGDQGSFVGLPAWPYYGPVHRECSLRSALGGIGHLDNHSYWCKQQHDPDAGYSYRQSALMVWDRVAAHGFPAREEP
jgi:hypothetical protein